MTHQINIELFDRYKTEHTIASSIKDGKKLIQVCVIIPNGTAVLYRVDQDNFQKKNFGNLVEAIEYYNQQV